MSTIARVEDLNRVSQLTTGAILYTSQSGLPYNTTPLDMINCISSQNIFTPNSTFNATGQALGNQINSLSGISQTIYTFGCNLVNPTGSWIDIGNFNISPHNLQLMASISYFGISITKQYNFTNFYENAPTVNGWRELIPSYTSGPWQGTEDFAIDFSGNLDSLFLRLRHSAGTATGIANIIIENYSNKFSSFGNLNDTFTRTFATGIFTGTPLTKVSFDNFGTIYYPLNSNPAGYGLNTSINSLSGNIQLTGSNLQNQINNLSVNAGVSQINGISGNVNIAGAGTSTVSVVGQNIIITSTGGGGILNSTIYTTAIDWSVGNTFYGLFTGGSKTITFLNTTDGQSITASMSGLSTGSITWPANVKWPSNSVPSPTSGAVDVYTFVQIKNNIYATAIQNYSF